MRFRQWFAIACGVALVAATTAAHGQAASGAASSSRDGMVEVKSKRFDHVFLRPGADFRGYTKVMLDPTQVTFATNWLADLNNHKIAVLQGTTAADADRIAAEMRSGLRDAFANTFRSAGYEVVSAPGADVLAVSVGMTDLYINAPVTVTQALPSRVYTHDAGEATLALDLRDSTSGAMLGRVVDHRIAGNRGGPRSIRITTTASNQFDFESLFDVWAQYCTDELKAQSPVALSAPAQRRY
jgi:ABC-type amino acid transport substrate-binding protein